eukprot:2373381-Rhodomonas_salina.3
MLAMMYAASSTVSTYSWYRNTVCQYQTPRTVRPTTRCAVPGTAIAYPGHLFRSTALALAGYLRPWYRHTRCQYRALQRMHRLIAEFTWSPHTSRPPGTAIHHVRSKHCIARA